MYNYTYNKSSYKPELRGLIPDVNDEKWGLCAAGALFLGGIAAIVFGIIRHKKKS